MAPHVKYRDAIGPVLDVPEMDAEKVQQALDRSVATGTYLLNKVKHVCADEAARALEAALGKLDAKHNPQQFAKTHAATGKVKQIGSAADHDRRFDSMASVQPNDGPAAAIRPRLSKRGEPLTRPTIALSSPLQLHAPILDWTLAALGMLLAGWLRWSGLGRQSLWVDEMSSFGMADTGLRQVIPGILAFDAHPPLYILIVHFAHVTFKLGTVDSVRVPSVLAAIATVGIVYALARVLVGRLAAIVATALVTLSPLLVWYSREGRMYALTWLFVMLSYLALVQATRSSRRIWLVTYGVAVALALNSDISAVLALVPQAVLVGYFFLRDHDGRSRWLRIAAAGAAGWILFVPWLAVLPRQLPLLHGTYPGYEPSLATGWHLLEDLTGVSAGYASLVALQLPVVLAAAVLVISLAAIVAVVWLGRSSALYAAVTVSLTLGPAVMCGLLLIAGSPGVLLPRVMGITAFGLALAVAGTAELAWHAWRPRRLALAAVAAGVVVVVTGTAVSLVNVEAHGSKGQDWRAVAGLISSHAQAGDAVIYYPYGLKIMVDAYLPAGSHWIQDGHGLWHSSDSVVQNDFTIWADGAPHVWIVFYAATGIDMPRHDAWLVGNGYQRILGDPASGAGVLEYVPASR